MHAHRPLFPRDPSALASRTARHASLLTHDPISDVHIESTNTSRVSHNARPRPVTTNASTGENDCSPPVPFMTVQTVSCSPGATAPCAMARICHAVTHALFRCRWRTKAKPLASSVPRAHLAHKTYTSGELGGSARARTEGAQRAWRASRTQPYRASRV